MLAGLSVNLSAEPANDARPRLCPGTWHLSAGQTTSPMGPGAAGGEGQVELRVHDCGELVIVHEFLTGIPDGLTDRGFHRDFRQWPVYIHETHAEMPVVVSLRMVSPRRLVGEINIAGGAFTKPLELTLSSYDPSLGYGCGDERYQPPSDDRLEPEWDRAELVDALLDAMRQQGLSPPAGSGLSLRDYIHARTVPAGRRGTAEAVHRAHLRLGPNGEILPREDALYDERLACEHDRHELQPATHWLAFKPHRHTDGTHETAAQYIEVETGVTRRQQMKSGGPGASGLADSLGESWDALNLPPLRLSDGRS